jgi:hypothetical protein
MNCLSWNVRGLESPDRKFVIKRFLNSLHSLDFFMMQEIKAVGFTLDSNLNYIWKDAIKLYTNHVRGRGGIALLINNKWEKCITNSGCSPCHRAVWVTLHHDNNTFGVCAIYASNDPKERIELWKWITDLPDIPWLFGGDFNMVESHLDKSGGNPFHWKDNERSFWNKLLSSKCLFDPIAGRKDVNPGLWHTWCNFQQGNARIYSRLDRFYANKLFFSFPPDSVGNIVHVIATILSDHHPILTKVNFICSPIQHKPKSNKFILNSSLLLDEDVLAAVQIIRGLNNINLKHLSHTDRWNTNLSTWRTFLQTIGQKKAKDYRFVEKQLSTELQVAEESIQCDSSNMALLSRVMAAKEALSKHQQFKIRGARLRSRSHWLQYGDRGSKFFFNLLKHKRIKESVDRLSINNQDISDPETITQAFANYYETLFASEDSPEAELTRTRCKNLIPRKLDPDDIADLAKNISVEEIAGAIKALNNEKAPGPDGFSVEFYKANIGWICNDLFDLYSEAFTNGTLGQDINRGIIKLLPKEGDKTFIRNWRPITLLNVSYKILAKVMALRLVNLLPKFVNSTQTGFIKGRYILENLITSWEAMDWSRYSHQNSAMLLLDFEKAYDRVEWKFILMMLEAFGFPPFFRNIVAMLLKDASAQVEVNGMLSAPFSLGRSIRQGCPLAPALFVIASEALYYILRDNSLSQEVRGIYLPNNEELINCQFADDTALFLELSEINFRNMQEKLNIFCFMSGAKISQTKSIFLGWDERPPDWFLHYNFQWGGPNRITRYLGIPFSVEPDLKDMWSWVREKIVNKLNKWHNRALSLAGRIQVCQKILSSYTIYYSSAWCFNNYQIAEIQKAIRQFLWSDGKGNGKIHSVKWAWCHTDKTLGGLGLKDLKTQGIALSAKWIFQAMEGDAPWKVLVRSNIERGVPRKAKSWSGLPFCDLILGNFSVLVQGSAVFKSIWKAWDHVRTFITNKEFHSNVQIHGERSIWWNLHLNGKPLALTQGCSARLWAKNGIKSFMDLFDCDSITTWEELKVKFDIPDSHKRTYNMIVQAIIGIPTVCHADSHRYLKCKWPDGIITTLLKAKNIYKIIENNTDILDHINAVWYSSFDADVLKKYFDILWKNPVEPKIKCFKWLLLLDKLPMKRDFANSDICNLCKVPETSRHLFLDCIFAKEIWNMFGIVYPVNVTIFDIISGYINGLPKDTNLFWNILSSNILWQLWKCRNEERYQGKHRDLTEFFRKLTYFKISLQVQATMVIERDKMRRFLCDGRATFYYYELKHGYQWRRTLDDFRIFELLCNQLNKEVRDKENPRKEELAMLMQIQEHKSIVWMEGPLGWMTWVDIHHDVLS